MDEGWTRLLLEQFEFPYLSVRDEAVKGNLIDEIDVLILPQDWKQIVVDVAGAPKEDKMIERLRKYYGTNVPPEYKSGIGSEGLDSLKQFVEAGGRLVALDSSCTIAIDALGLNVRNVVSQTDFKSFYCHGSTLRARIDTRHPLGYGMPECALVVYMDSPTFEIVETQNAHNYEIIAEYPERDLLQSGLLIGEDKIAAKPAMLRVKHGKGDVVLVGFRTQHRAQTDGTFKLLFNCLI